jgi:hypothetical protein
MKTRNILLGLCLLLSACMSIPPGYIGSHYSPTEKVDIYYSANDITRHYTVMGRITSMRDGKRTVLNNFTAVAQREGADAILIMAPGSSGTGNTNVVDGNLLKYTP